MKLTPICDKKLIIFSKKHFVCSVIQQKPITMDFRFLSDQTKFLISQFFHFPQFLDNFVIFGLKLVRIKNIIY